MTTVLAGLGNRWNLLQTGLSVYGFFGETHGKGQVDGLFGKVEGWPIYCFKTYGYRIAAIDAMEETFRSYA